MKKCTVVIDPCAIPNQEDNSKKKSRKRSKVQDSPQNPIVCGRKVTLKKQGDKIIAVVSKNTKPLTSPVDLSSIKIIKDNCINKSSKEQSLGSKGSSETAISKEFSTEISTGNDASSTTINTPELIRKASSALLSPSPLTANLNLSDTLFNNEITNISPLGKTYKLPVCSIPDPTPVARILLALQHSSANQSLTPEKPKALNSNPASDSTEKEINLDFCKDEVTSENLKNNTGSSGGFVDTENPDSQIVRELLKCDEILEGCDKRKDEITITTEVETVKKEEILPDAFNAKDMEQLMPSVHYLQMLSDNIALALPSTTVEEVTTSTSESDTLTLESPKENLTDDSELLVQKPNVIPNPNAPPMSATISSMFAQKKTQNVEEIDPIENSELMRVRVAESLLLLSELDTNTTFCISCKKPVAGICQQHGDPMSKLKQTKAIQSLPSTMYIQESSLPNAGLGVFSLSVFEVGSLFGPMEGEQLSFEENSSRTNNAYVWEVYQNDRMAVAHYLDCVDEEKSNWMRFVNCARFEEEQNLIAEQYDQLIFYKAYKKILPGDELLVWYGNAYGRELQALLTPDVKVAPIEDEEVDEEGAKKIIVENGKDKNGDQGVFVCEMCNAWFSCEYYLKRHRTYVCPASSEFRCDICSTLFKNMCNYRRHKKKGCKLQKTFQCIICGASLTQKANLKVHLKTHLNIRDFKCSQCDRSFSRATFLRNHVSAVHQKEQPFICNTCGRKFSRMDSMKRHKLTHTERNIICTYCGHAYQSINALSSHVARKHKNNVDMLEDKCRICHKTYQDIKNHMLNVHGKKGMMECPICKQSFRNLANHMSFHEEKKETCPVCNKNFVTLNGHMKRHVRYAKLYQEGKITLEEIKKKEEVRLASSRQKSTNNNNQPTI